MKVSKDTFLAASACGDAIGFLGNGSCRTYFGRHRRVREVYSRDGRGSIASWKKKGSLGENFYRFVVRTNGLDYDVVCDAATGVVKDVALRGAEETH